MLVRAFGASAFGLRGGIPMHMEAAETNVYHAPEPRARITRPIRIPITHATHQDARGADTSLKKSESALDVQSLRLGNRPRGQL